LGFILIKLANMKIEKRSNQKWYSAYVHPFGASGILVELFGLALNTMAVGYASIILLASTPCFTLVFNSMLAPCLLGEKF